MSRRPANLNTIHEFGAENLAELLFCSKHPTAPFATGVFHIELRGKVITKDGFTDAI